MWNKYGSGSEKNCLGNGFPYLLYTQASKHPSGEKASDLKVPSFILNLRIESLSRVFESRTSTQPTEVTAMNLPHGDQTA